jgi:hypothetical protein
VKKELRKKQNEDQKQNLSELISMELSMVMISSYSLCACASLPQSQSRRLLKNAVSGQQGSTALPEETASLSCKSAWLHQMPCGKHLAHGSALFASSSEPSQLLILSSPHCRGFRVSAFFLFFSTS